MEFMSGIFVGWIVGSIGTALVLCLFMGKREERNV